MARIPAGGTPPSEPTVPAPEPVEAAQDDQGGTAGGTVTSLDTKRKGKGPKKVTVPVAGPSDHGTDVTVHPSQSTAGSTLVDVTKAEWDELTPSKMGKNKHIYRASELGNCMAALVAGAMGTYERAPFPEALHKGADEGTALEPVIISRFCEEFHYRIATYPELVALKDAGVIAGYDAQYQQIATATKIGKKALLITHPDQIVTHVLSEKAAKGKEPIYYDVEVKAFGPDLWKQWKSKGIASLPRYAWQISARQRALGLTVIFVVGQKIEVDGAMTIGEIDVQLFELDKIPFDADVVDARIAEAEEHVLAEDVPACALGTWPCTFFKEPFCMGDPEKEAKPDPIPIDDVVLAELAGELVKVRASRKDIQTEHESVVGKIDKHVAEIGITRGVPYTVADVDGTLWLFEWVLQDRKGYTVADGKNSFPNARAIGKVPPPEKSDLAKNLTPEMKPAKKKKSKKDKKKK